MKLKHLLSMTVLTALASGARADDQNILLTQTAPGLFSGAFTETYQSSGLILDTISFSLPASSNVLLGHGALSFTSLSRAASLVLATLVDAQGMEVDSPPAPASIAFPSTLSFSGFTAPLTLTVLGSAGDPFSPPVPLLAAYSGLITFTTQIAAVPEADTNVSMTLGMICMALFFAHRKSGWREARKRPQHAFKK